MSSDPARAYPTAALLRHLEAACGHVGELERGVGRAGETEARRLAVQALEELRAAVRMLHSAADESRRSGEPRPEPARRVREERAHYRELFEHAPSAYIVTDRDGVIHEANGVAEKLLGDSAERLRGTLLPRRSGGGDNSPAFAALLAQLKQRERVEEVRLHVRSGSGVEVPVSVSVVQWGDRGGALLWLIRDVSQRVREEERTRQLAVEQSARAEAEAARERITNILESISDGFVSLDHEARFTYMNRRAEQLLGRSREDLLGHVGWDKYPELKGSVFEREYRRATELQTPVSIEEFFPPLQGWVELHAFPTADGLTIFFRSITGRKRAEANQRFLAEASTALASSIEHRETLETVTRLALPYLADSSVLYVLLDDATVQRVDSWHSDPEQAVRLRQALDRIPPRSLASGSPVNQVIETGRTSLITITPRRPAGGRAADDDHPEMPAEIVPDSLLVLPLVSRGRTFGAISLGRYLPRPAFGDADARLGEEFAARAALALDNAWLYAEAQRAARSRQDVLHIVSHDLRNSLNAALLHVDILLMGAAADGTTRARSHVEAVQRAALQMQRMVQDLLDAESIEAGRLSVQPRRVEAAELVDHAVQSLAPLLAAKSLRLDVAAEPDLPALHADPDRIQQVLFNLIGNAIKFSPAEARIDVRVDRDPEAPGCLRFHVADHGPGIAREDLPRVFERHWQGAESRGTGKGAGLGLTIARGIVEAHGGRIWGESEPGRGSVFFFVLPAAQG